MTHLNCFKSARTAALRESDAVVLIGTPLDFWLKYERKDWNPEGKLIQIENDPGELNHNRKADVALLADARSVLEALSEGLQGLRYDDWLARVRGLEADKTNQLEVWKQIDDEPVNHFRFGAAIDEFMDDETIIIGDGGDIVSACAKVINLTLPGQ